MSAREDELSYQRWTRTKAEKLSRSKLDCGCRNAGQPMAGHIWCNRIACLAHADDPHDCSAYGGVKDSIEEAPEPVEAVELSPEMTEALDQQPRCADCGRWAGTPAPGCDGCRDLPVPARFVMNSSAPPLSGRVHPASPYLTREDITGRRPDRVAEAFRDEVRRQGLTECVIDGVPEHVEPLRQEPWQPILDALDKSAPPARLRWWQWRPW